MVYGVAQAQGFLTRARPSHKAFNFLTQSADFMLFVLLGIQDMQYIFGPARGREEGQV